MPARWPARSTCPGDVSKAYSAARAEAAKNGYTTGVNGVDVTPLQDAANGVVCR